jgi:hypothetical protein
MIGLKEKIKETIAEHKAEIKGNLIDKTIHVGNLKNIGAGDKIFVHWGGFRNIAKISEVTMLAGDAIYIRRCNRIVRFHAYNCMVWHLDDKKPESSETTKKENWNLANSIPSLTIIEYPIINVKYKEKQQVPKNHICYNVKEQTACPFLSYFNGFYDCNFLHRTMYGDNINGQICNEEKWK